MVADDNLHDFGGDIFHFANNVSTETGVFFDSIKFGVGQTPRFGDDVDINTQLAEIMQQTAQSKSFQLFLCKVTGSADGKSNDRNVDRVSECVVVVIFEH